MRPLARATMRGPLGGTAVISLSAVLAVPLVLPIIISGAALGLVTLRRGGGPGMQVMLTSLIVSVLLSQALMGSAAPVFGFVLGAWLPIWALAMLLRWTSDQGIAMLAAAGLAGLTSIAMHVVTGDVNAWWTEQLARSVASLGAEGARIDLERMAALAQILPIALAIAVVSGLVAMLLLARWWQSLLYNPGGFREEFHALVLPAAVSSLAAICGVGVLVQRLQSPGIGLAMELLMVMVVLFAVQGLAVTHHRAAARAVRRGWLVGIYMALLVVSQVALVALAAVGLADTFVDFRGIRSKASAGP